MIYIVHFWYPPRYRLEERQKKIVSIFVIDSRLRVVVIVGTPLEVGGPLLLAVRSTYGAMSVHVNAHVIATC